MKNNSLIEGLAGAVGFSRDVLPGSWSDQQAARRWRKHNQNKAD
ncbi:MAG: hypothetical protein U5L73_05310 [Rhodoferax sp.]|nr:hypothetical protein [Rhodoferax sp.]MDZ7891159.1 hypothetical protein [Rhodoferax sp.]